MNYEKQWRTNHYYTEHYNTAAVEWQLKSLSALLLYFLYQNETCLKRVQNVFNNFNLLNHIYYINVYSDNCIQI